MARWAEIAAEESAFAKTVQARFDKYRHKVLATIRSDGSPRVSGIEVEFKDGDVRFGMMEGSKKALDLQRDPRLALHSGTEDPPEPPPAGTVFDAKISGVAVAILPDAKLGEEASSGHGFLIDVREVVLVTLGDSGDHLSISIWREGKGLKTTKRY